jgi:hypothetical protein
MKQQVEKMQVDKMAIWRNGKLMKQQVEKNKLIKWRFGDMAS